MNQLHQKLSHVEKLTHSLVVQFEEVKHQKELLEVQLSEAGEQLEAKNTELQQLKSELEDAKIARGFAATNEDSDLAKSKISSLMREIDRCIALLNE